MPSFSLSLSLTDMAWSAGTNRRDTVPSISSTQLIVRGAGDGFFCADGLCLVRVLPFSGFLRNNFKVVVLEVMASYVLRVSFPKIFSFLRLLYQKSIVRTIKKALRYSSTCYTGRLDTESHGRSISTAESPLWQMQPRSSWIQHAVCRFDPNGGDYRCCSAYCKELLW